MRISKAISIAVVMAMALAQIPAIASGNAHKYPVVPKEEPAASVAIPAEAAVTKPDEADIAKANSAVRAQPPAVSVQKPAEPLATTSAEAPPPSLAQRLTSKLVIVSRYEPLSGKDSLEVVPDLNRGHSGSK